MHIEKTLMKLNMFVFYKKLKWLEKYDEIWNKIHNTSKRNLIRNLCKIKNISRLKQNLMKEKSKQIFIPKEVSQCICLSVMLIDPSFSTDKNCYPQVPLEQCKYVFKEKKDV